MLNTNTHSTGYSAGQLLLTVRDLKEKAVQAAKGKTSDIPEFIENHPWTVRFLGDSGQSIHFLEMAKGQMEIESIPIDPQENEHRKSQGRGEILYYHLFDSQKEKGIENSEILAFEKRDDNLWHPLAG